MRAMVLTKSNAPLQLMDVPIPKPQSGQVLIKVIACGVCRTDLHVRDEELHHPSLPLILGHQGEGKRLGFYGFGAAAHILIQIARHQGREIWAFTRAGDDKTQTFAKALGAVWAGGVNETLPILLDAALIFAPAGELVPLALQAVKKGGSVVCAGIYMTDIPSFPYAWLYGERVLRSVTNLTREDGELFFNVLNELQLETAVNPYPLEKANEAMDDLKSGKISGSAVLVIDPKEIG